MRGIIQSLIVIGLMLPLMTLSEQSGNKHYNAIVVFTRPSCPYCIYMAPIIQKLQLLYGRFVHFKTIVLHDSGALYKRDFNFSQVPTIIYYDKHGNEVRRHGSNNKTITFNDMERTIKQIYNV